MTTEFKYYKVLYESFFTSLTEIKLYDLLQREN